MKLLGRLVALVMLFSTAACVTSNPFIGVWKVDPVRSRLVAETIRYQDLGAGRMRFSNAGATSYEFALDGKDYQTGGNRAVSWKPVAPGEWETTVKRDGKITETAHRTLSPDGKALNVLVTGELPNGMPYRHKRRYLREGTGEGLAGTWRNVEMDTHNMPDGYVISESSPGVITWLIPTDKQSITGRFDGSEMPLVGATAAPGTTFSVRKVSDRKITYTIRANGKVDQYGSITISEDGDTFTEESWPPGRESEKSTIVFGRYRCSAQNERSAPVRDSGTPDKNDPNWLCAASL